MNNLHKRDNNPPPSPASFAGAYANAYENLITSNFDALIGQALAGVTDTFNTVCGADTAWLAELRQAFPDIDPPKARFLVLLVISRRAHQIRERALDFMEEQRRQYPELQELIADLMAEDSSAALCSDAPHFPNIHISWN